MLRAASVEVQEALYSQAHWEELLFNAAERPASLSLQRAVARLDPIVDVAKFAALDAAATRLMLHEQRCGLPELLDALQSLPDEVVSQRLRRAVVSGLAAELAASGCSETPRPRLIEAMQLLLGRRWIQLRGAVEVLEELLRDWPESNLQSGSAAPPLPPCLTLLTALVEVAYGPELVRAIAAAPKTRQMLALRSEMRTHFPLLAAALAPLALSVPQAGFTSQDDSMPASSEEHLRTPVRSVVPFTLGNGEPIIFDAVEDLGGPATEDATSRGYQPFCIWPTFLPPNVVPGICHSGLLLGGTDGIVEEWDLDAGFRVDRLSVAPEACDETLTSCLQITALAAPDVCSLNGEPDVVAVAAVNGGHMGAGLAILHRDEDTRAWQVEAPWLPEDPSMTNRRLAKFSRIEFLKGSSNLMVAGQMTALGANESGLYDTAIVPARPLMSFAEHTDFVTDVCSVSSQTFASVSLDASLLLWDLRFGFRPAGRAGFDQDARTGISSIASARGSLLMCGTLLGDCFLFDARCLSRPLLRPPSVRGAVVRLRLWAEDSVGAVAALASSEEGLCSLFLGAGIPGIGVLRRAAYGGMGASAVEDGDEDVPAGDAMNRPRLCFDVARAVGGGPSILACGSWGVTRYRQVPSSDLGAPGPMHQPS